MPARTSERDPATDYARRVVAGEVVTGRLVKLACERHLRDLETGHERGLKWEVEDANAAVEFFGFLALGDGRPFKLEPFQQFKTGCLFGWKAADGHRRFRTAYLEEAKGQGKTPWASGVLLYLLVADGEPEPECYCAAVTREQASIAFRDAKRLAESSPALQKILDIGQYNVAYPGAGGFLRAVSSEQRGLDGRRVAAAVLDEIHEHPTALVVDKIRAGTKARRQPLIVEITNSGYDRTSVCWEHHQYSVKVLTGVLEDDSWFAYVCQLDACPKCEVEGRTQPSVGCPDCDQWEDESVWIKANPGLDTILPRKYLRDQVHVAQGMPANESIVKRLNFCLWVEAAVHAVPMDRWDQCRREADEGTLIGQECYAGVDLGATSDFTAFARLFPDADGAAVEVPENPGEPDGPRRVVFRRSYTLRMTFWLPERPRRRDAHMEGVIALWRRRGQVRTTPGDVVDYRQVLEDILELHAVTPVVKIGVDRGFQGAQFCTDLQSHFGNAVETVSQGIVTMNAPFREFVELVTLGRMHHDGDPVMRWMCSNCAAETRGGLMKPSKDHSAEKIDGLSATCMALALAMRDIGENQWYQPGCLLDR